MSASHRLNAALTVNLAGDLIVEVEGLPVVGIVWDDDQESTPLVVIWDESGAPGDRIFPLFTLMPRLDRLGS